jgi:hypothetical protein
VIRPDLSVKIYIRPQPFQVVQDHTRVEALNIRIFKEFVFGIVELKEHSGTLSFGMFVEKRITRIHVAELFSS